jgi:DNA-directed RNA polymerase specialized sigma24 family protein
VTTDDASLLLAWKGGAQEAGEALFERYYHVLARFFANKALEARDDLIQATLLACLEKVEQLREATRRCDGSQSTCSSCSS